MHGETKLEKVQSLQDGLLAVSTGGAFPGEEEAYKSLRRQLLADVEIGEMIPDYVRRCRDLSQYWHFIKHAYGSYAERRMFIWDSFRAIIDKLEDRDCPPAIRPIGETLQAFDPEKVHAIWEKALDRRFDDPDGAITAARSLLESVCKHILDDERVEYPTDVDLPKLYALCAEQLNLAPQQHQEKLFKTILGNCQTVVNSLGALRNAIGDAHGVGRRGVRPKPRHAALAVNLAGAMAAFLVSTWQERRDAGGDAPIVSDPETDPRPLREGLNA